MSNLLTPIITNAGRDAMMQDIGSKQNYRISLVGLGLGDNGKGYVPTADIASLKAEKQRAAVSAIVQNQGRLHVTAVMGKDGVAAGQSEYEVREIGFYLQMVDANFADKGDPLLFAVYATDPQATEPLLTKDVSTELLLAFDLDFPIDDKTQIPFDHNSFVSIPSATEIYAGTVRLATMEDIKNESATAVVTPAVFKQAVGVTLDNYGIPNTSIIPNIGNRMATLEANTSGLSNRTTILETNTNSLSNRAKALEDTARSLSSTTSSLGATTKNLSSQATTLGTRTSNLETQYNSLNSTVSQKADRPNPVWLKLTHPQNVSDYGGYVFITRDDFGLCQINGSIMLTAELLRVAYTVPPGYTPSAFCGWPVIYFPNNQPTNSKVVLASISGNSLQIIFPEAAASGSVVCLNSISYSVKVNGTTVK